MTKADIAKVVYERHGGISNREAARLVEVIFETIKARLGSGQKVQITGFGTFMIRQKRERRGLVEVIFETIKARLGSGQKVQITGFGTFMIRQKRERRGRNPQTGEEMVIRPRRSVVFRPSKLFGGAAE